MKPEIHLIGNAHLDPIWLWRWQEGCGEVLQTFRSAVNRLKEYDDFIFTCSSAAYYRWVEEIDPELFSEIAELVKAGKWVPVNGWWVQPDCNIPSGESFARQALYSQLYYYEKFGCICRTGYNVDSFGHNGMLPQLLTKGGMRCYVMMRPSIEENPEIPENLFWWESNDGSRVLTYRIPTGYGETGIKGLDRAIDVFDKRCKETGHGMMLFYGVGNHGGGPTKGDISYLLDNMNREGYSALKFSSPDRFFKEVCMAELDLPVWTDDLQHHASGCYSATSMVKKLNRKCEIMLENAEKWNTFASGFYGMGAGTKDFSEAWKDLCFNQFHDILCGCSIMEAYDDVRDSMGHAMTIAARYENNALLKISSDVNTWLDGVSDTKHCFDRHHCRNMDYPRPVVVFNPLSFEVDVPVRTYHPSKRVQDSEMVDIPFQNVRSSRSNDSHSDTVFTAKVPAMGYRTYWLWNTDTEKADDYKYSGSTSLRVNDVTIENDRISVTFDKKTGAVSSFITKCDSFDYSDGKLFGVPQVIDNTKPDTWAHNIFKFDKLIDYMKAESVEVVENGPVRAVVRIKYVYNKSYIINDYILGDGADYLRVKSKAMWQEPLTIVKAPFTLDAGDTISTYEIPASFIERPCNGEEEPAQKWADISGVCKDGIIRGISVMNDSKYSYDCPDKTIRLTLLRNSIFADHYSNRPDALFNYTDEGIQRFEYGIYPHSGPVKDTDIVKKSIVFNNRPNVIPASYKKGSLPLKGSFLKVDKDNIVVTAVKYCEDNSGDIIIRAYESAGKDSVTAIRLDMVNAAFYADFNAHEIKTFRIDKEGFVKETNFLEGIVK